MRIKISSVYKLENMRAVNFGFSVLNDLKSRGILDVYILCVDSLKGFQIAISAVCPKVQ